MALDHGGDWRFGPEFPRFLSDLIAAEFARMRPGAPPLRLAPDDDLGTDSLEHLRLALAVTTTLRCARPEWPDRLQELRSLDQWVAECRRIAGGAEADISDAGLAFKTSGSTGEPRFVAQDFAALAQEVEALAKIFSNTARIVAIVPAHHIYGFLFTVLLPGRLGVPVLDGRPHSAFSLAALLREGDCIVAFPTFWQAAAEAGVAWPKGASGATSGAPCPPAVGPRLRENGLARLVEIYGATETAGVGWRDSAGEAFRLFAYWTREDEDRIAKDFGAGLRLYELPDVVSWIDERRLLPIRRRDGAVQVGGVNVYPEFLRAVLKTHPLVADATVRKMRPEEGDRLKAFVVPKQDVEAKALRGELETWLQQRVSPAAMPRAFSFGPSLPTDDRGKPGDWPI